MSAFYHIKVTRKKGKTMHWDVIIVHPDRKVFPVKKSFALQAICDLIFPYNIQDSSLGREINNPAHLSDSDWYKANAAKYIAVFKLISTENFPVSSALNKKSNEDVRKFWNTQDGLPRAVYLVKTTEEKWIDHISENQEWDTGAIDII